MKLYDENMNEIFLYSYTESNEEGVSFLAEFYSKRKIPQDEIDMAYEEHSQLIESIDKMHDDAELESGLVKLRNLQSSKKRLSEEEGKIVMERYNELRSKIPKPEHICFFLKRKFDLVDIDFESL